MNTTRREFLKTAALTGAGIWLAGEVKGSPNDQVNFGCIGVGGKGGSDTKSTSNGLTSHTFKPTSTSVALHTGSILGDIPLPGAGTAGLTVTTQAEPWADAAQEYGDGGVGSDRRQFDEERKRNLGCIMDQLGGGGEVDPQHRPVVQLGGVEVIAGEEQARELIPGEDV